MQGPKRLFRSHSRCLPSVISQDIFTPASSSQVSVLSLLYWNLQYQQLVDSTMFLYQQLVDKYPYQQSIDDKEFMVDKVVLVNKDP